jgi:hypothetical protein
MAGDQPTPFLNWREEWQRRKEDEFFAFVRSVEHYASRTVSFREKMRALYLFGNWTGYRRSKETSLSSLPEQVFESWFFYDYVNVKNERVVERVMKEKEEENNWEYASALIASYFSVFCKEKAGGKWVFAEWCQEIPRFALTDRDLMGCVEDWEYYLMRPVKVGVKLIPLSPVIPLSTRQAETLIAWLRSKRPSLPYSVRIWMQREGMGVFRMLFGK